MKKIFITGITGQLGSELLDYYLNNTDNIIYGMARRSASGNLKNISHRLDDPRFKLVSGDITDITSIESLISSIMPDILINTAAQSHVHLSWEQPTLTHNVTGLGVLHLLNTILRFSPQTKMIQMSTSEMMGNSKPPQNEETLLAPESPYGIAKLFGHEIVKNFRKSYGLKACCAICFNFESIRRSQEFVTQKIVNAAVKISLGKQNKLILGNINAKRDWSSVHDIAKGIVLLADSNYVEEFVFGSGISHTVEEFADMAFKTLGLDYKKYLEIDEALKRPSEVHELRADASKAKRLLGWQPEYNLQRIIDGMIHCVYNREKYVK